MVPGTLTPGGVGDPARHGLQRGDFQRCYAPGGMRHPPGGLNAAAPGGTCPLPSDFVAATLVC